MTILPHKLAPNELLAALFASKARAAVVRLLMLDPARAYYQRQIEAATGLTLRAVQRELDRLVSLGLLYRRQEGNRIYYQVDQGFLIYAELRALVLKTAAPIDRLRGLLAVDETVRLAFLDAAAERVLVVWSGPRRPVVKDDEGFAVEWREADEFIDMLATDPGRLAPFLDGGEDLLGRRDDILWRRIETAGYSVSKRKGVA